MSSPEYVYTDTRWDPRSHLWNTTYAEHMARRQRARAAAQAANASLRTPVPELPGSPEQDVDMQDVETPDQGTPQGRDEDVEEQDEDEQIDEDGEELLPGTPDNDSAPPSRLSTPRGQSSIPRKRRAGRPARMRSTRWENQGGDDDRDEASDAGTPNRRGGWRGRGFGRGRWGKPKGGPSHTSQVPVDKEGNMANVVGDEVELPEDAEGEMKVDKNGYLQDGREYRVRVFTIQGKGDRLYMLSTEPARCIGFRDSYLFFQKHRTLYKIILHENDKLDLIERDIMPHSYKGRAIGVVTARSVFREFGAKIVVAGKKITDDYQVSAARASGDVEGELAVPEDQLPATGARDYNRNQYVAWHGASSVYHSGGPSVPMPSGKIGPGGPKRKTVVTGENWMLEHARAASRFNSDLTANRRANNGGVYEVHTNMMQYPKIMQPTHARWEEMPTPIDTPEEFLDTGYNTDDMADEEIDGQDPKATAPPTIFPPVDPLYTRNYMVADIHYTTPSHPNASVPGPDGDIYDIGPKDLTSVSQEIIDLLPPECLQPFLEERARQAQWKASFGTEAQDTARAHLHITKNQYSRNEPRNNAT